jgi:uncharacterized protein YoxC
VGDARITGNKMHDLTSKISDLTTESSNLRERNMSLEREVRDKVSIIDRLRSKMGQMDQGRSVSCSEYSQNYRFGVPTKSACITSYT